MESSALKNPKHEAFASYLAAGKSQAEAYRLAGYKPNDANATRLIRNDRIKKRVAELTAMKRKMVLERATIDTLAEMHRMIEIVHKAADAGDFRAAIDGQKFILTCFGYADSPTLSHEHLATRPLPKDALDPATGENDLPTTPQPRERDGGDVVDFGKVIEEMKAQLRNGLL